MKSVLVSIQPRWCALIASGKKTIEVRKTRPKLETPFKVYIYCTFGGVKKMPKDYLEESFDRGTVIGEFICDTFIIDWTFGHDALFNAAACLTEKECAGYSQGSPLYGWHISELKIYDNSKKLSDFIIESNQTFDYPTLTKLTRAPQSWCYVEGWYFQN